MISRSPPWGPIATESLPWKTSRPIFVARNFGSVKSPPHLFCCEEPSILTVFGSQEDGSGCRMLLFFWWENVWRLKEFEKYPQPGIILNVFVPSFFEMFGKLASSTCFFMSIFGSVYTYALNPTLFECRKFPPHAFLCPIIQTGYIDVWKSTNNQIRFVLNKVGGKNQRRWSVSFFFENCWGAIP